MFIGLSAVALDFSKSMIAQEYTGLDVLNTKYGFGIDFGAAFSHPYIKASLSGYWLTAPVIIKGVSAKQIIHTQAALSFPSITKAFCIFAGYRRFALSVPGETLFTIAGAPVAGIGLDSLSPVKNLSLGAFAGWNAVSVLNDQINFALFSDLLVRYSFGKEGAPVRLYLQSNTSFDCLFISKRIEWSLIPRLSIGAVFNDTSK